MEQMGDTTWLPLVALIVLGLLPSTLLNQWVQVRDNSSLYTRKAVQCTMYRRCSVLCTGGAVYNVRAVQCTMFIVRTKFMNPLKSTSTFLELRTTLIPFYWTEIFSLALIKHLIFYELKQEQEHDFLLFSVKRTCLSCWRGPLRAGGPRSWFRPVASPRQRWGPCSGCLKGYF